MEGRELKKYRALSIRKRQLSCLIGVLLPAYGLYHTSVSQECAAKVGLHQTL